MGVDYFPPAMWARAERLYRAVMPLHRPRRSNKTRRSKKRLVRAKNA